MQEFVNKFKPYTGILIVLIVAFSINRLAQVKNAREKKAADQLKLAQAFIKYVPENKQAQCDGLGELCKKFYVGRAFYERGDETVLSLHYLLASYNGKIVDSLTDDPQAKERNLTAMLGALYAQVSDYDNAIKYTELAVEAGGKLNVCTLGSFYNARGRFKEAYQSFKKGACNRSLGMYAFNGIYIEEDREHAGEYWKKAYDGNRYGETENDNLARYYSYQGELEKYKFHLLKAAKLGMWKAGEELKAPQLQGVNATRLFIEESLGGEEGNKNRSFAVDDFRYRLELIFNRDKNCSIANSGDLQYLVAQILSCDEKDKREKWERDDGYRDKIRNETGEHLEKFDRGESSLIYKDKKLMFTSSLNHSFRRDQALYNDLPFFYQVWLVDLSDAESVKRVTDLYYELVGRLVDDKSFEYSRKFSLYGDGFVWYAKYDHSSKRLLVEIRI